MLQPYKKYCGHQVQFCSPWPDAFRGPSALGLDPRTLVFGDLCVKQKEGVDDPAEFGQGDPERYGLATNNGSTRGVDQVRP
jgi:hypothetical protein